MLSGREGLASGHVHVTSSLWSVYRWGPVICVASRGRRTCWQLGSARRSIFGISSFNIWFFKCQHLIFNFNNIISNGEIVRANCWIIQPNCWIGIIGMLNIVIEQTIINWALMGFIAGSLNHLPLDVYWKTLLTMLPFFGGRNLRQWWFMITTSRYNFFIFDPFYHTCPSLISAAKVLIQFVWSSIRSD